MNEPAKCRHCGKPYQPKNYYQRFCHVNCRTAAWHRQQRTQISAANRGGN